MTKITNELLEDYAMLYPKIECIATKETYLTPIEWIHEIASIQKEVDIEYIQLRSIESITDEEAEYIGINIKYERLWEEMQCETVDYLRSIGIATPFRGITVDELIESGKLKLI